MPLVGTKPDTPLFPIDTPPQITKPEFRGIAIDTEVIPETALITHVQGSPYSVTYFRQVLSEDSGLSGTGAGITTSYQQYCRIFDMVLMVTSELSYSQATDTKDGTYTGSATVYPFLIPNEGDQFIGELGNGKRGIFEITSTRRLSVYKQTCHDVEFKLVRDATEVTVLELERKTIQTFYYDKSFLDHGQNPLLFEEEYELINTLRRQYVALVKRYIGMFFSREFSTILVGGQTETTYDPKMVRFLQHMLSVYEAPEMAYIRSLNTDCDPGLDTTSMWDALIQRNPSVVSQAYTRVGTVSVLNFSNNPMLESIRYSGISRVVYPFDMLTSIDMSHSYRPMTPTSQLDSIDRSMVMDNGDFKPIGTLDIEFLIDEQPLSGFDNEDVVHPVSKILYHPIGPDGFYVLSGYFYRNNQSDIERQSQLESQIHNFLNNRAIDIQVIRKLVDSINDMKPLEQFYLTPLILLLIRQRIFITV